MERKVERAVWAAVPPEVTDYGDVGGDHQQGPAFGRRWLRARSDGLFDVADRVFYVMLAAPPGAEGKSVVEQQDMFTVCRDPANPGDTEVEADYRYFNLGSALGTSDDDVRRFAANAQPPTDQEWSDLMGDR